MESVTYTVRLKGASALVMNSNAALLGGKEDKGRDPAQYEREHYLDKCYRNEVGGLVIPARAIKKAFIEACKFMQVKPKGVGFKTFGPFIQSATLFPEDAVLDVPIERVKPLTLVVNLDPTKGPKGGRGPRTRPAIAPPWSAETTIYVLDSILTLAVLEEVGERAGMQVGFLDGRAIDFGRAAVTVTRAK